MFKMLIGKFSPCEILYKSNVLSASLNKHFLPSFLLFTAIWHRILTSTGDNKTISVNNKNNINMNKTTCSYCFKSVISIQHKHIYTQNTYFLKLH